jgi:hypothetical protein
LLGGVLNLLGKLLSGLGLDSLLKGIVAATVRPSRSCFSPVLTLCSQGLDKIYAGLGLDKWLKGK